ncbi:TPA: acyltransferase [Morganella morganii]
MSKDISIGLNVIRIVACFMVILLHSAAMGIYKNNEHWPSLNIIDSFTRVCVPLFIMLSGALLIKVKNDSIGKTLSRIIRVLLCLLLWSIIYVIREKKPDISIIELYNFISSFLTAPVKYHLWYLYAVVGIYISIPIISNSYFRSSRNGILFYILGWFLLSGFYSTKYIFGISSNPISLFRLDYLSTILGYLLLGKLLYDLVINNKKVNAKIAAVTYVFMSLMTGTIVYLLSSESTSIDQGFYSYLSPITIIASASVFIALIKTGKHLLKYERLIGIISSGTLGAYCMHVLFVDFFYTKFIYINKLPMNAIYAISSSIIIFVITIIISVILRKIKPLSVLV